METTKKLYPLKFNPEIVETSWGKAQVAISDTGVDDPAVSQGWLEGNNVGDVLETYLEKIVGEDIYQYYGRQFPLAIKFLDIRGKFPATVHPDDEIAEQRYDALGGNRLWYVLKAGKNARIFAGFSRQMNASELYERCLADTLEETLNVIEPKAGDSFCLRPGMVYAADGELQVVEIAESSALGFTLSGSNGSEDADIEFNIAESLDFIDLNAADNATILCGHHHHEHCECREHHHHEDEIVRKLVQCREFSVNELKAADPLHIYTEKFGRFIIYVCIEGKVSLQVPSTDEKGNPRNDNYYIEEGELILVPADMPDFFLVPVDRNSRLLEVMVEKSGEEDAYIDPSTEAYLEGEDYEGVDEECDCGHHHTPRHSEEH